MSDFKQIKKSPDLPTTSSQHSSPQSTQADISSVVDASSYQRFSPNQIIQMQRTIGNKATQKMIAQRKSESLIQREPDGLIDLGDGFRGEVGIEGKIKKGAVVTKADSSTYTLPEASNIFVHDIMDKNRYFVQIPGYVIDKLKSAKKETRKEATKDLENKSVSTTGQDSAPVKGTVRKKDVSETKGQMTHKKVSQPLFPHDPIPDDIEQRQLGNCYFLSALGSVAAQHPSYLREMMQDGDDTISVRFYRPKDAPQTGFDTEYVTVRKSVVKGVAMGRGKGLYSATHVPWPALATKAYAAWSGHAKAGLPGFGGTYEATAGGKSNAVFEHILGDSSETQDVKKGLGSGFINLDVGDKRDFILPGHPKRPKVEPWNSSLKGRINFFVNPPDYSGYLTKDDDPKDKVKAFLVDKVTGPAGIDVKDIAITKMGTMFKISVPPLVFMKSSMLGFLESDLQAWLTFVSSKEGADKVYAATHVGKAAGAMDEGTFRKLLQAAKVSKGGITKFIQYVKDYLIGTPDNIYYNPSNIALYTKIEGHLAKGGLVNASTDDFGKGGGISGGEDTVTVPGIAGGHAYTALSVRLDEESGRRFIKLRNPWGSTGMAYSPDFSERKKIDEGTFELEFSDFVRFYSDVQYSSASSQTQLGFKVADIKHK